MTREWLLVFVFARRSARVFEELAATLRDEVGVTDWEDICEGV